MDDLLGEGFVLGDGHVLQLLQQVADENCVLHRLGLDPHSAVQADRLLETKLFANDLAHLRVGCQQSTAHIDRKLNHVATTRQHSQAILAAVLVDTYQLCLDVFRGDQHRGENNVTNLVISTSIVNKFNNQSKYLTSTIPLLRLVALGKANNDKVAGSEAPMSTRTNVADFEVTTPTTVSRSQGI